MENMVESMNEQKMHHLCIKPTSKSFKELFKLRMRLSKHLFKLVHQVTKSIRSELSECFI